MKKKNIIMFYKNMVLTPQLFIELNEILSTYSGKINYSAKTKNGAEIKFDSFQELLSYDNSGKDRIQSLTVMCWKGSDLAIIVYIPEYIGKATIKIEYEFSSLDEQSVFKTKVSKVLEKASYGGTIPLIIEGLTLFIFLIIGIILTPKLFYTTADGSNWSYYILSELAALVCYWILYKVFFERVFPKVVL